MYDVAVAGLGGMGSAVLAHCAMRGARAVGIEQFGELHALGSSTGRSRIIRQAYFEDSAYVPLLLRAYELWRELEYTSGEELLLSTGLLMVGKESSEVVSGSLRAARTYALPVEELGAADIRARYPSLRLGDEEVGVFEREGGVVFPERAIRVHLELARDRGAELRFHTGLDHWETTKDGVDVRLSDGTCVRARALVLTLGPWFTDALREAGVELRIQRNVQVWYAPATAAYEVSRFPAFLLERESLPAPLYGFPDFGDGVKAAFHGHGDDTTAPALDRTIDLVRDVEPLTRALDRWMPGAAGRFREAKACMYSLTPDRHFAVGLHPNSGRVVLCGGFSGHGFKFAPVVGEIGAQLALDGASAHDIAFLSPERFRT